MSGFKVDIHDPCIYLAENHLEPPLDPEADKWFKEARRLEKLKGQTRDYKYIAELYQKAAEKKHWKAMYNLSTLYDIGLGVEKSAEKSIALGKELIAMDATHGYVHLGSISSTGLGVPKNMKKRSPIFTKQQFVAMPAFRPSLETVLSSNILAAHRCSGLIMFHINKL